MKDATFKVPTLHEMDLHDSIEVTYGWEVVGPKDAMYVVRVPGGWIYKTYYTCTARGTESMVQTFVPFSNEFKLENQGD